MNLIINNQESYEVMDLDCFNFWNIAVNKYEAIKQLDKEYELLDLLETEFPEGATEEELNDFMCCIDTDELSLLNIDEEEFNTILESI